MIEVLILCGHSCIQKCRSKAVLVSSLDGVGKVGAEIEVERSESGTWPAISHHIKYMQYNKLCHEG